MSHVPYFFLFLLICLLLHCLKHAYASRLKMLSVSVIIMTDVQFATKIFNIKKQRHENHKQTQQS